MELQEVFDMLADGINPTTGEVFDLSAFNDEAVQNAFKKLKNTFAKQTRKTQKKGNYARLCEAHPEHLILVKTGIFYSAFNEAAEIFAQIMGYNVGYTNDGIAVSGGPDLSIIAERLQATNISYIAYRNGEIEDQYDGKNPFI